MHYIATKSNFHPYSATYFKRKLQPLKWHINPIHHKNLDHIYVKRYIQGYFNNYPLPPKKPRTTWDIQLVLEYLKSQPDNHQLDISKLGPKVAMLILLAILRRKTELLHISIKHMFILPQCVSFSLVEAPKTYTVYNAKEHL